MEPGAGKWLVTKLSDGQVCSLPAKSAGKLYESSRWAEAEARVLSERRDAGPSFS